jgi:thioredoxin-related protein
MKLFLIAALLLFTESNSWLTSLDAANETARKENKLILLNFSGSDWCAPCIKLKRQVFETELFKEYATQNLVLLNADFPRMKKNRQAKELIQHNESLAARYNREGKFPYTLLLDAKGNVKKIWDGYGDQKADKFISEIKKALEK